MIFSLVADTYPGEIKDIYSKRKNVKEMEHETYGLDVWTEVKFRPNVL